MAKSSVQYVCSDCGWNGVKWFGRCPSCGSWGTIEEFHEAPSRTKTHASHRANAPLPTVVSAQPVLPAQPVQPMQPMQPQESPQTEGSLQPQESPQTQESLQPQDPWQSQDFAQPAHASQQTQSSTRQPFQQSSRLPQSRMGRNPEDVRIHTGFSEFDRVLGGGIVPGSVVLMAGEPGIGKSTLLLETAANIARQSGNSAATNSIGDAADSSAIPNSTTASPTPSTTTSGTNAPVLYISGEESQSQVRMRAQRIGATCPELLIASTTDLGSALTLIEQTKPRLVVADSVQTIYSDQVDGIPGGSTQVREVATALIDSAKRTDTPMLLVGHVTKDGSIAGPRTLEHLVDVVCQFEGEPQTALRLLRSIKNRFGPTDEVGCFDMSGEGIEEVRDPSGLFLSDGDDDLAGTCITFTMDGHRSLPIEVQALVTKSVLPSPRRATNGIDQNRLAMIVAVVYRHAGLNLLANDLYVSTIAGGSAREPADDLAIAAALASAATDSPIDRRTVAFGEISLTGQIRPVPRLENRLREAARLGYKRAVVPRNRRYDGRRPIPGIELVEVRNLAEALRALGVEKQRRRVTASE
ncbi:AAA family ATPase [Pseudoscardovia suis]|uniref:DNA repair protein RadA n=1 Tax=Pseudoscardovia suis TaxID=987063 RepID=UPI003F9E7155